VGKPRRFGVRRFAERWERPDCFEVFDRVTGECKSFGCYRFEAEQIARCMNKRTKEANTGCNSSTVAG